MAASSYEVRFFRYGDGGLWGGHSEPWSRRTLTA